MLTINDLKPGTVIRWRSVPHQILESQHLKKARGGALLQVKIKNLITGAVQRETFKPADRFEEAAIERIKSRFIYSHRGRFFFELAGGKRLELAEGLIGDQWRFLKPGAAVELLGFQGRWLGVRMPIKIILKVKEAPPGLRGDTSGRATKEATLETGYRLRVPLFIAAGDLVRLNTQTGEYVERAKSPND